MGSGRYLWVSKLIFVGLLALLFSCKDRPKSDDPIDFSVLENGDIIYRHGNGLFSEYFKNTSETERLYSHSGVIWQAGDSIFVIHSEASEFTGVGGVKKERLDIFLKNISTWAVYRLDTIPTVRGNVVKYALEYYDCSTPFDFDFDNTSDHKLYCTELIAVVVNKVMNRDVIIPTGRFRNKKYFAVDDTYLIDEM